MNVENVLTLGCTAMAAVDTGWLKPAVVGRQIPCTNAGISSEVIYGEVLGLVAENRRIHDMVAPPQQSIRATGDAVLHGEAQS